MYTADQSSDLTLSWPMKLYVLPLIRRRWLYGTPYLLPCAQCCRSSGHASCLSVETMHVLLSSFPRATGSYAIGPECPPRRSVSLIDRPPQDSRADWWAVTGGALNTSNDRGPLRPELDMKCRACHPEWGHHASPIYPRRKVRTYTGMTMMFTE